jgi:hypothetical protein
LTECTKQETIRDQRSVAARNGDANRKVTLVMVTVVVAERQSEVGWKDREESVRTCNIYRRVALWTSEKCRS